MTKSSNPAIERTARLTYGLVLLGVGLFIYLVFAQHTAPGVQTTFGMNLAGSEAIVIPDLAVPARLTVQLMALIAVFFGIVQLIRGFRGASMLVASMAATFVVAFVTWAAQGKSFSLTGMLNTFLVGGIPIGLAALCGLISERSAVINIGIEGIMLLSAQT